MAYKRLFMGDIMKILFVCHGNICRSPMAEFLLKNAAKQAGIAENFEVESAAVSAEELGNPVYPPVRKLLKNNNINCDGHRARQLAPADYKKFGLILCMDADNVRRAKAICGGDPEHKILRIKDLYGNGGDVADPWYTGDFSLTWREISAACDAIITQFLAK